MLFAQDLPIPATPTTIMAAFIAVSLSLVALVGWLMRHVFLTTIPEILKNAEAQRASSEVRLDKVCQTFKDESQARSAENAETLAAERKLCDEKFQLVNASIGALASASASNREATIAAINQHTTQATTSYRHDIKDIINEAVLGKELHLAQKSKLPKEGQHG